MEQKGFRLGVFQHLKHLSCHPGADDSALWVGGVDPRYSATYIVSQKKCFGVCFRMVKNWNMRFLFGKPKK